MANAEVPSTCYPVPAPVLKGIRRLLLKIIGLVEGARVRSFKVVFEVCSSVLLKVILVGERGQVIIACGLQKRF